MWAANFAVFNEIELIAIFAILGRVMCPVTPVQKLEDDPDETNPEFMQRFCGKPFVLEATLWILILILFYLIKQCFPNLFLHYSKPLVRKSYQIARTSYKSLSLAL